MYESSSQASFKKLLKIIKSVHDFEESHAKGKTDDQGNAHVKKYVLGTKKDIKPIAKVLSDEDFKNLMDLNIGFNTIEINEVSALSGHGIREVF